MRILRTSCFVGFTNKANLDIVVDRGGEITEHRFEFDDAQQLLDAADKMRLCGFDMLREAPRPK